MSSPSGRLVALGTTRAGDVWDVTQWGYDPATGLCTNKTYADGSAVVRAYDAAGRPTRITLASGHWTQTAYDAAGRVAAETRSDGTAVLYSYDAFGRLASSTEGTGRTETFARDALGRVTNETQTVFDELFWTNRTAVLDRPLDAVGRPAGLVVKIDGDFAQSICYDYGVDGHLSGMVLTNAQGRSVSVEYDWEQGRLAGCTVFDSSGAPIFARTQTRASRRPALVTTITNAGFEPLTSNLSSRTFSYAYDAVGRPVERGADAFAYNARGEVTNATISGATWGYAYDHIGNREAATAPSGTTAYAANALNQYAAVTGRSVAHDADGNMTRNGERNQTWDAAGRLVKSSPDLVQRWQTWQDFDYDYRGRRTAKYTQIFFGGMAPPVDTHLYFYDDWNLVHETTISETYQIKHVDYFWGPDLSGSLQGAGGVGGLVAVSVDGDYYFPGYDNNGNVIGYWNEDGEIVAEYAYDAFGNTISSSGSMASVFPHRFSTKYHDAETELYYYGYRYYSPALGRWISRDPMGENDSPGLFLSCRNNPLGLIDRLGLHRMITGALLDKPNPQQDPSILRDPGVDIARDILRLLEKLNQLVDRNGKRYYRAEIKNLVITPMADVASEIDSNPDNIYVVAHGGIQKNGRYVTPTPLGGDFFIKWEDGMEEGFDIRYDGGFTPLSAFGNKRKEQNFFGCHITDQVRKKKHLGWAGVMSNKGTYLSMFRALLSSLQKYQTPKGDACETHIVVYEGNRHRTGKSTEEALSLFPTVPPEEYYTGKEDE